MTHLDEAESPKIDRVARMAYNIVIEQPQPPRAFNPLELAFKVAMVQLSPIQAILLLLIIWIDVGAVIEEGWVAAILPTTLATLLIAFGYVIPLIKVGYAIRKGLPKVAQVDSLSVGEWGDGCKVSGRWSITHNGDPLSFRFAFTSKRSDPWICDLERHSCVNVLFHPGKLKVPVALGPATPEYERVATL